MAGEPIGSAFVEVRADLSRLDDDARDIEERLRKALAPPDVGEDYHAVANRMRSELGIGADAAGEDIQAAFREAAHQSSTELSHIGGPETFSDVRRGANDTGDSIRRSLRDAADDGEGSLRRVGDTGLHIFRLLAGAAAAFGAGRLFKGAIDQASDLNESINAVNVTFGENAAGIQKLGEQASDSLGLTQNEFNAVAVSFGNFATTIAGPGGDVTKTMEDLTGRASDFASVMNLQVADANDLFRSGLSGESEPLRKFGIDVSEASVKAFAYANGIAATGDELTEAQKVQARYGLIMQQTNKVQGDFANTSGELANGLRILRANALETGAQFGSAFLPALKGVVGEVNDTVKGLAEPLAALGGSVGSAIAPLMEAIGPTVGIVIRSLSDVVTDIGSIIGSLAPLLAPVVQIIGVLATAVSGSLAKAFKALEPAIAAVAKFLDVFAEHLGEALFDALDAVTPLLTMIGDLLGGVLSAVLPTVIDLFDTLVPPLVQIGTIVADVLMQTLPGLASTFTSIVNAVLPLVGLGLEFVLNAIAEALTTLAPILPALIDAFIAYKTIMLLVNGVQAAFNLLMAANPITLVAAAIAALVVGVIYAYNHFQTFHDIVDQAWQIMQQVWDFITNVFITAWHGLQDAISAVTGFVQGFWDKTEGLRGFLVGVFSIAWGAFKLQFDVARDAIQLVVDVVQFLWDHTESLRGLISGAFATAWSLFKLQFVFARDAIQLVVDVVLFLWHSALQPLIDFAEGAFASGIGVAKAVLGGLRDGFQWVIDKVEWLINRVKFLIDLIPDIPNLSPFGGLNVNDLARKAGVPVQGNAFGDIITRPTLTWVGENSRKETIVPNTRPARALQLMDESGLGAMWDAARGGAGPLVSFPGAVFQDATDADLVAQRAYAAMSAKMLAAA